MKTRLNAWTRASSWPALHDIELPRITRNNCAKWCFINASAFLGLVPDASRRDTAEFAGSGTNFQLNSTEFDFTSRTWITLAAVSHGSCPVQKCLSDELCNALFICKRYLFRWLSLDLSCSCKQQSLLHCGNLSCWQVTIKEYYNCKLLNDVERYQFSMIWNWADVNLKGINSIYSKNIISRFYFVIIV